RVAPQLLHAGRARNHALAPVGARARRGARGGRAVAHAVGSSGSVGLMDALGELWTYLTTADNWSGRGGILTLTWAHVRISVTALVLASVIAVPPAVVLGHVRRGGTLAVSIVNLGRALPSFGILALALPISIQFGLGLGFWPTLVPL